MTAHTDVGGGVLECPRRHGGGGRYLAFSTYSRWEEHTPSRTCLYMTANTGRWVGWVMTANAGRGHVT